MSEIDRLNREVKKLNGQIRNLQGQLNTQYQSMQTDMRRQMQEYEKKSMQKMQAQSQKLKSQYDGELAAMRQKMEWKLSQEEKAMSDKYLALTQELEKTKEEAAKRQEELKGLIQEYSDRQEEKDQKVREQADSYMQEMQEAMNLLEQQPYETFYPGKMNTYKGSFHNVWNLMKNGLFQAAAAVAVSVRGALERFSLDVDFSRKMWEREFEEVCRYCDRLGNFFQDWEEAWIAQEGAQSSKAEVHCAQADLNYWTSGWYLFVKEWMENNRERNLQIQKTGTENYLKTADPVSIEQLQEESAKLQQYLAECPPRQRMYEDIYRNAVERMEWSEAIADFMVEEKCFAYDSEEDEMRQADSCLLQKEYFREYNTWILEEKENTDDYQGWYMMQFHGENRLDVEIGIMPMQTERGWTNIIQFHVKQGETNINMEEILMSVRQAIQTALRRTDVTILNTNKEKEKEQLQMQTQGRQMVSRVEQSEKSEQIPQRNGRL